jgi:uncharacterized membrane protein YdjX (TVP38/TMEM64 family)
MSDETAPVPPGYWMKLAGRSALLIGALVAAGFALRQHDFAELAGRLAPDGAYSPFVAALLFTGLGVAFTGVGGPRQAVSFAAAYLFGLAAGIPLALLASIGGCIAGYSIARIYSRATARIVSGRVQAATRAWASEPFAITLIIRLLPVGSNLVANLAAGAARIPALPFFAGSAAGYVPQTIVFALMGSGVNVGSGTQLALSVALFVASAAGGAWVWSRYRKRLGAEARSSL